MNVENFDYIPWDEIPVGDYLPECVAQVAWESLEDAESNSGNRMFKAVFEIVAPEEFAGRKHFENYTVGTDVQPTMVNPLTFGAKNLNKARIAAQIQPLKPSDLCAFIEANQPQFLIYLKEPKENADFQNNNINQYFKLGEREPEIVKKTGKKKAAVKQTTPPKPPTMTQPAAASMSQTKELKKEFFPATQKSTPEVQQTQPVASPQIQQTQHVQPQYEEPLLDCPSPGCNEKVPASQLAIHMATHFG